MVVVVVVAMVLVSEWHFLSHEVYFISYFLFRIGYLEYLGLEWIGVDWIGLDCIDKAWQFSSLAVRQFGSLTVWPSNIRGVGGN